MKKIAYVINFIVKGGPSSVVLNMIHNLDRTEYEPILITLFEGNSPAILSKEREHGLQIIECNHKSRLQFILQGLPEYQRILKDNHIDIVHGHGFVPDVMNARLGHAFKTISTAHNIMFEDYRFFYGPLKAVIYCRIHIWAMRRLDRVVCCSKSVYEVMKDYIPNCQYIENGIEDLVSPRGVSRADLHIPMDAIVFLYVGHLIRRKRVPLLIKNFTRCHSIKEYLLVLGTGEEMDRCKELADSHVIFVGFQSNPYQYMEISDIYTSASSSEGFSISVLEALYFGLGLLLSDIPSHREIINGAGNIYLGEVFHGNDFSKAYSDIISNLSKLNADTICAYQRNFLSAMTMTKRYQEMYQSMSQR